MARTRFVTLTTDIGWAYAAQMKAALAHGAPRAVVVDVTHEVPRHAIAEGAFLLAHVAPQFPAGSVHVAVVDPGVGGARDPIAVATRDGSFLVGPDNGVLHPAAERMGTRAVVELQRALLAPRGPSSATFEGRDVFAPAAARLAGGTRLSSLGSSHELHPLRLPRATKDGAAIEGEVLYVDPFGNAITNIPGPAVPSRQTVALRVGRGRVRRVPLRRTYEDAARGTALVLVSSFGLVEVAVREGSAAERFGLSRRVSVRLSEADER